jgi:hypothetical protein
MFDLHIPLSFFSCFFSFVLFHNLQDGRRLVHIDSVSSSFKVVDNLGSCYISVKLVLPDGHEIPKEKVRGETPGSGGTPEVNDSTMQK